MKSSVQRMGSRADPSRLPLRPLGWSLALHLAVLAAWQAHDPDVAALPHAATVLQGTLLPPSRPPAARPRPPPVLAAAAPLPAPTAVTAPSSAEPARADPSAPSVADAPVNTATNTRGPHEGAAVLAPPVPSAAEIGPDPAGLRQFRLALAGEARRFRSYPAAARRAGLAGTAEVRVVVDAGGLGRHADLVRSSGHEILDRAALDMLRRAAAQTLLPASLSGQQVAVLLPVVFALED
jgi:periplasmic protein TonB